MKDGDCTPPAPEPTPVSYKIGDYYPDPGATYSGGVLVSGTAATGVVFWVGDADAATGEGLHGKAVSLMNADYKQWADFYTTIDAADQTDGRNNMAAVNAYTGSNSETWSNFPAFAAILALNGQSDYSATRDEWYLPSRDELHALYAGFSGLGWSAATDWLI